MLKDISLFPKGIMLVMVLILHGRLLYSVAVLLLLLQFKAKFSIPVYLVSHMACDMLYKDQLEKYVFNRRGETYWALKQREHY